MKKIVVLGLVTSLFLCSCTRPQLCERVDGEGNMYSFTFIGSKEALTKYVHNEFPDAYGIFKDDDSSKCYFFVR